MHITELLYIANLPAQRRYKREYSAPLRPCKRKRPRRPAVLDTIGTAVTWFAILAIALVSSLFFG